MKTLNVEFVNDDGDVLNVEIPATFAVCSTCEGEGRILNPSIGQHAYSQEEMAERGEEFLAEYLKGGSGIYGVQCPGCDGKRVALKAKPVDDTWTEEQREALKAMRRRERERREDARTYKMECGGFEQ